ncbi:MAG: hypothetical protein HN888_04865 [Desulfobacula sp.]|nr:hypothetical protein [Desulfobacula sp.]
MFTGKNYEEVYNNFDWDIPKEYNIGVDICDKWASTWRNPRSTRYML